MDNIANIIKSSRNRLDALKKLNWDVRTVGYRKLNRYIKKYEIDVSHFETRTQQYERTKHLILQSKKLSLEEILISNSTYANTSSLKKRLYNEGLKQPICEECGQDENWRGKHISMILDHINGKHDDNRLENLRIVCPNCNAALPTHCGRNSKRNKKEKALKSIEQKKVNKKLTSIKARTTNRPDCLQLQRDIEELGFRGTGNKYGVSDNSIRKWLKFYEKYDLL